MTIRTRTLLAALMGALALAASGASFADPDHGYYRGNGWGHQKHGGYHKYRYDPGPYGYVSFYSAPPVVYAPPPAYYGPRYGYPAAPAPYPYGYPLQPSFSFGMTVPLD